MNQIKTGLALILLTTSISSCGKQSKNDFNNSISSDHSFYKVQLSREAEVLNYFQVPKIPEINIDDLNYMQTAEGVEKLLPLLDPKDGHSKFFQVKDNYLYAYQDADNFKRKAYHLTLLEPGQAPRIPEFYQHIQSARNNSGNLPLAGLKIALDPGHMGGHQWDIVTGKFVHDEKNQIVSEGFINLVTAQLLKDKLSKLGAQVFITRNKLAPVTDLPIETFSLHPFGLMAFEELTLDSWYLELFNANTSDEILFKTIEEHPKFQTLFSERRRDDYFTTYADLEARAHVINQFKPDITIIIHYDTADSNTDPQAINPNVKQVTKAYTFGSFSPREFASRRDRLYFVRHLMDPFSWQASLDLNRSLIHEIKTQLNVKYAPDGGAHSIQIEPGIFSRNLHLPRMLGPSAVAYVECLMYNEPSEFKRLSRKDNSIVIDGQKYTYSDRLVQIANALRDGILKFAKVPSPLWSGTAIPKG